MQNTIEEIHATFDTSGEKILAEAKEILSRPLIDNSKKQERLRNIGFTATKPFADETAFKMARFKAQEQVEAIEYYQLHYPNYKFITEDIVQEICKKYGLLYGEAEKYIGDIPDKNISEIEAFKLREEDYYKEEKYFSIFEALRPRERRSPLISYGEAVLWAGGIDPFEAKPQKKKSKPAFKICAPQKDFNIQGYEVVDGYKLVYDPIVIQPVKYKSIIGGLIISKWGLEGQDESLVNEKMN